MSHSFRWQPIRDYERDPSENRRPELHQLASVWKEQIQLLSNEDALEAFSRRLRREWSIETGLLERIYTLDRGVTQVLIEQGIDAALIPHRGGQDPRNIAAILRDHEEVIDGLFAFVKGDRELSVSYIKELHAALTRNQPTYTAVDQLNRSAERELHRGVFKSFPNSPTRPDGSIHEYCPPEHVASEMDQLIRLHKAHLAAPCEVEAAWLHHRFTQIHPFEDGNGRVARCLSTLVLIRAGWFPLTIRDIPDEKKSYIGALESADEGELDPLVRVFAAAQRRAFVQALGIAGQTLKLTRVDQVIAAAKEKLEQREREVRGEWDRAKDTALRLLDATAQRFGVVAASLKAETSGAFLDSRADSEGAGGARAHYFRHQIIETAKVLGYFANPTEYHAWARLALRTVTQAEVLISFHAIGHVFRGVLAVSACYFRREFTDDGEREIAGLTPLVHELFQINYKEDPSSAKTRYETWLEEVLLRGLEQWRQDL